MAESPIKRIFGVRQSNGGGDLIGFDKQNALYAAQQTGITPDGFDINNPLIDWYMGPDENAAFTIEGGDYVSALVAYTHFNQDGRQAVSTIGTQGQGNNDGQPGTEPAYVAFKRCAAGQHADGAQTAGAAGWAAEADQSFIDAVTEVAELNNYSGLPFHSSFEAMAYIDNVPGGAWTDYIIEVYGAFQNAEWKYGIFENCDGNFGVFRINPSDAGIIQTFAEQSQRVNLNYDYHDELNPVIPNWTPYGMTGWQPLNTGGVAVYDTKLDALNANGVGENIVWRNYEGVATINPGNCEEIDAA